MSPLRVLDLSADQLEGEVVVAFYFAGETPVRGPAALLDWRLGDPLTRLLASGRCRGLRDERVLVRSNGKIGSEWVLFLGAGRRSGMGEEAGDELLRQAFEVCRQAGFRRIALCLEPGTGRSELQPAVRRCLADLANVELDCLLSMEPV